MPRHREALLTLAERQLAEGHLGAARATARRLLAAEPLEGRGFRVLAAAADQSGEPAQALALYEIAAKRSPRDTAARAWLAEHYLVSGQYRAGLAQIDAILRKAPARERVLLPLLGRLAADPVFAAELAGMLARRPTWRSALLSTLATQNPGAADGVLSSLRQHGGLTDAETDEWLNRLMQQGRWEEAYGRWAATLPARKSRLTAVYNGDFADQPSNRGFDWRVSRLPNIDLEFVSDPKSGHGFSAHASFRDRPVSALNLEQPLLLPPGAYRLSAQMRAVGLASEQGLEWTVVCDGAAEPVGSSSAVGGTFAWRTVVAEFRVPPTGCSGQWLRLLNPAPGGSAQTVKGELWLDDVSIVQIDPAGQDVAILTIDRGTVLTGAAGAFRTARNGVALARGQRLLLLEGSVAAVEYPGHCTERYKGPDVPVIDDHCGPLGTVGPVTVSEAASTIAAAIGVEKAILGNLVDTPSPPAGR